MSRQYYDDPYAPTRRRVPTQSYQQSSNNSPRRNGPSTSRDFASQSTFQPNRERYVSPPPPIPPPRQYRREYPQYDERQNSPRPSSNWMNDSSNDRPQRRYRLEPPPPPVAHSHARRSPSYYDNDQDQDLSRSSDRHRVKTQQPSSNYPSNSQSNRYNQDHPRNDRNPDQYGRRHHREENYPSQPYPQHSNHRSVDVPVARQRTNPVRPSDHTTPSSYPRPTNHTSHAVMPTLAQPPMPIPFHHPASLLTDLLQSFFGVHGPSSDDDDDNNNLPHPHHSSVTPIDLIAFAWMMQRPDGHAGPATIHIQFGDLFDILGHEDAPSVGLSESDIERIPTMTYRKTSKSKGTDDKCAICLSEYKTGETVKRLRCKHFFHPDCIDPWLKTSTQCPICRGVQTD